VPEVEPFHYPVAVRYYEVDGQGVVFNMWYLGWFDEASTAFLGHVGFPYSRLVEDGMELQLVHTEVDWRGGAAWGEPVEVGVRAVGLGRTSLTLGFEVLRGAERLVSARTVYVTVREGRAVPVPADLRSALRDRLP